MPRHLFLSLSLTQQKNGSRQAMRMPAVFVVFPMLAAQLTAGFHEGGDDPQAKATFDLMRARCPVFKLDLPPPEVVASRRGHALQREKDPNLASSPGSAPRPLRSFQALSPRTRGTSRSSSNQRLP